MHEQLGAQVPFGQPDYFDLVVNRSRRSFTARDHQVMDILRHHVAEAFRTASASPSLPSLPLLEALESIVGGSLIALDLLGAVVFSSPLAQQQLDMFFSEERPFHHGLPLTVRQWITQELVAFNPKNGSFALRKPLINRRGDASLHMRLASNHDATAHVVILHHKVLPVTLLNFALSHRKTPCPNPVLVVGPEEKKVSLMRKLASFWGLQPKR